MTDASLDGLDVAVVHGNYFQRGGAEVVAEEHEPQTNSSDSFRPGS